MHPQRPKLPQQEGGLCCSTPGRPFHSPSQVGEKHVFLQKKRGSSQDEQMAATARLMQERLAPSHARTGLATPHSHRRVPLLWLSFSSLWGAQYGE